MKGKQVSRIIMILFLFFSLVGSLFLQVAATPLVSSKTTSSHTEDSYKKPVAALCDDSSYSSIQDAIDHASPGSTIYVNAGTYTEILSIHQKINLVGEGSDVTILSPTSTKNSYAIRIAAEGVTLSGFTITNHGEGIYTTGVKISASHTTIKECTIHDTPIGIAIWSSENTISRCTFQGCDDEGIVLLGSSSSPSTKNWITDCTFSGNCDGVELQYASDNILQNCVFSSNTHAGIDVIESSNNRNSISYCDFLANNAFGIYLSGASWTTITHCSFSGNTLTTSAAQDTTISQCRLSTVRLADQSSATIKNCENVDASHLKIVNSQYTISDDQGSQQTHLDETISTTRHTTSSVVSSLVALLRNIVLHIKNLRG